VHTKNFFLDKEGNNSPVNRFAGEFYIDHTNIREALREAVLVTQRACFVYYGHAHLSEWAN